MRLSRRSFVIAGATAAGGLAFRLPPAGAVEPAGRAGVMAGVNLAGADFGQIPGKAGTEYAYPTKQNIAYYRDLGFHLVRLPFKWERLQPEPMNAFAEDERRLLRETAEAVLASGMKLVLDPHNYAKRRLSADGWSAEHLVGSDRLPAEALYDLWVRLARDFGGNDDVFFGLMNEPVGLSPEAWLPIVNGTIAAIRKAGADNLVLVPGVDYTGAHSWLRVGNDLMGQAVDPAGRIAFDAHQYLDKDSSGTRAEAVSGTIGAERIEAFQEWARAHRHMALLGEFGGGDDAASLHGLADLCAEMAANPDVWLGWAAWAGGPRWPDDNMHTLEPYAKTGRERPQTSVLKAFAAGGSGLVPILPETVLDLDLARARFFGIERAANVLVCGRSGAAYAARRSGMLDAFQPDELRITDLGLLIEEERRNRFSASTGLRDPDWKSEEPLTESPVAPPVAGMSAYRLSETSGRGWCALQQEVDDPGEGALVASIHAQYLSRGWLTIRGDRPSSTYAAFDVETAKTGNAANGDGRSFGYPWAWQRLSLAWRPAVPGPATILFSLQDSDSNSAAYERTGAGMDLWGPMLEEGAFATSYHPATRSADVVSIRGPLATLLDGPEWTIVLELRDLPQAGVACEILGADGTSVLQRTAAGALRCGFGAGAETTGLGADAWRGRRKVGLSVAKARGLVVVATTGAKPVAFSMDVPSLSAWVLGSRERNALNGRVTRIVGSRSAADEAGLAEAVA